MSLLGNLTVGILGNMSGLSDTFNQAQSEVEQFGSQMESIGDYLSDIGSALTQTFGPAFTTLGGLLGVTAIKAMDFEQQMSSVKSVMSPDEVNSFGKSLEKLAIQMGAETKYSSLEAAQGIEELIKAGVSVTDIINGGLEGALSLAVAGELDLASAAEIASTALNAFKDDNLSVIRAADLLAGAANASATSVSEMKFGLSMVSAVASGVGLTFEDTATALATFAQNGLKGSDAGTSLKTMLLNLSPSTKEATEQMAELGLLTEKGTSAFYNADGSIKSLAEISELLKTKLAELTDEQRQMALKTMFGTDAIRAANILYKEGADGITTMAEAMNKISSADVAATKLDNVKGRIEILKGTMETAAISIGNVLLPVIDNVVASIQKMTDWFNNLSPQVVEMIAKVLLGATAFTGLATAFGVVLMLVGGVISSVGTIATAFAGLSGAIAAAGGAMAILTGPIGLTVAAIVGLGAALIALWNNSETFRTSVTNIFNSIKDVAVQAFGVVASFIGEKIAQIKGFWDSNGTQFLAAVENVFNGIKAVIEFVMPAVLFIVEMVWTAIKQVIDGALNVIMGLMKVFSGLFTGDFSKMWEGIKQIFSGAIDLIIGWMTLTFVGGLRTLLTNLARLGVNLIRGMADGIVGLFRTFTTTGSNLAKGFVNTITNFFRSFVDAVITLFQLFKARGESTFSAFSGVVRSIFTSLGNGLRSIWQGAITFLTNGATIIRNGITTAFNALLNSVRSIWGSVRTTVETLWGNVMDFFRGIDLRQIGKDIIQGLINGIGSMASAVWEKAKSIASGIGDSIRETLDIHSPSRVMQKIGEWIGIGLANGMDNSRTEVKKSTDKMIDDLIKMNNKIGTELRKKGARFKEANDAQIEATKKWYEDQKYYNNLSLTDELRYFEYLKVLAKKNVEEREKADREIYRVKKEIHEKLTALNDEYTKKITDANEALREGELKAENEYASKLKNIKDTLSQNEIKAKDDYLAKVKSVNEKLVQEEQKLNDEYNKSLENRRNSLYSFAGLFDSITRKDVTGQQLLDNLSGQIDTFKDFQSNLGELSARGLDQALLAELQEMGPKAAGEIAALNSLSDDELNNYVRLWQEKNSLVTNQAVSELEGLRLQTQQKIQQLRLDANTELKMHKDEYVAKLSQLRTEADFQMGLLKKEHLHQLHVLRTEANIAMDQYKTEWVNKVKEIRTGTVGELDVMKSSLNSIGVDSISGMIDGMDSMVGPLTRKAQEIANIVAGTIKNALKIKSPSRVMMALGEFVGEGFIDGIDNTINSLMATSKKLANAAIPDISPINHSFRNSSLDSNGQLGNSFGDVYVSISAKDVQEFNTVVDFFNRLPQAARSR